MGRVWLCNLQNDFPISISARERSSLEKWLILLAVLLLTGSLALTLLKLRLWSPLALYCWCWGKMAELAFMTYTRAGRAVCHVSLSPKESGGLN